MLVTLWCRPTSDQVDEWSPDYITTKFLEWLDCHIFLGVGLCSCMHGAPVLFWNFLQAITSLVSDHQILAYQAIITILQEVRRITPTTTIRSHCRSNIPLTELKKLGVNLRKFTFQKWIGFFFTKSSKTLKTTRFHI